MASLLFAELAATVKDRKQTVVEYLDDLYIYLRARAVGAIPRGRPPKKEDKPQAAKDYENSCMGG